MPPPRIRLFSCFNSCNATPKQLAPVRAFSVAATSQAAKKTRSNIYQDPYVAARARARKAANESRQAALKLERQTAFGDPVHGIITPFVTSFDTALSQGTKSMEADNETEDIVGNAAAEQQPSSALLQGDILNHYLTRAEYDAAIKKSEILAGYVSKDVESAQDPEKEKAAIELNSKQHQNAVEAMARIMSMNNSSGKDRLRVNIRRCVDTFGRHNTDHTLQRKPESPMTLKNPHIAPGTVQKTPRAGPDTGSSEVQIAILTAKIRALSAFLSSRGKHDKVNKRNLRVLVHKRQKLLAYLRKKERGGERWLHCIETLGLTESTWRGEISL